MLTFWDPDSLSFAIDWSAWATFAVGIAAVWGAYRIGQPQVALAERQIDITERQAEISARQATIENTRLRAELYDRRVSIYEGIEQYLVDASMNSGAVSAEVRTGLFRSISVAPFLLGQDVEEIGKGVHRAAAKLRGDVSRLDDLPAEQEDRREGLITLIEGHHDELNVLGQRLQSTMERYLRLADIAAAEPEA